MCFYLLFSDSWLIVTAVQYWGFCHKITAFCTNYNFILIILTFILLFSCWLSLIKLQLHLHIKDCDGRLKAEQHLKVELISSPLQSSGFTSEMNIIWLCDSNPHRSSFSVFCTQKQTECVSRVSKTPTDKWQISGSSRCDRKTGNNLICCWCDKRFCKYEILLPLLLYVIRSIPGQQRVSNRRSVEQKTCLWLQINNEEAGLSDHRSISR